jgi:hypothetical protein
MLVYRELTGAIAGFLSLLVNASLMLPVPFVKSRKTESQGFAKHGFPLLSIYFVKAVGRAGLAIIA